MQQHELLLHGVFHSQHLEETLHVQTVGEKTSCRVWSSKVFIIFGAAGGDYPCRTVWPDSQVVVDNSAKGDTSLAVVVV